MGFKQLQGYEISGDRPKVTELFGKAGTTIATTAAASVANTATTLVNAGSSATKAGVNLAKSGATLAATSATNVANVSATAAKSGATLAANSAFTVAHASAHAAKSGATMVTTSAKSGASLAVNASTTVAVTGATLAALSVTSGAHIAGNAVGESAAFVGSVIGGSSRDIARMAALQHRKMEEANATDMEIYCSDIYTSEFILGELEKAKLNPHITSISFEDVVLRNDQRIMAAVLDLISETALMPTSTSESLMDMSLPEVARDGRLPPARAKSHSVAEKERRPIRRNLSVGGGRSGRVLANARTQLNGSRRVVPNNSTSSTRSPTRADRLALMQAGSARLQPLAKSFSMESQRLASMLKLTGTDDEEQPASIQRTWESITFCECISDPAAYKKYKNAKHEFQTKLRYMLKYKGITKLPLKFTTKLELHAYMDLMDVMGLLKQVEKDQALGGVEASELTSEPSKIPSMLAECFDKQTLQWTSGVCPVAIRLRYNGRSPQKHTTRSQSPDRSKDPVRRSVSKINSSSSPLPTKGAPKSNSKATSSKEIVDAAHKPRNRSKSPKEADEEPPTQQSSCRSSKKSRACRLIRQCIEKLKALMDDSSESSNQ